jgi:hypothetical protein
LSFISTAFPAFFVFRDIFPGLDRPGPFVSHTGLHRDPEIALIRSWCGKGKFTLFIGFSGKKRFTALGPNAQFPVLDRVSAGKRGLAMYCLSLHPAKDIDPVSMGRG